MKKIINSKELEKIKKKTNKIVLCHGVFDILHLGHIHHFNSAKKKGDILVISITDDKYVNKGPGRPFFNSERRADYISHIESVDYVYINKSPSAEEVILKLKPDFYAKGFEYKDPLKDLQGNLNLEKKALKKSKGELIFTDDEVFSSSHLINNYLIDESIKNSKWWKKVRVDIDDNEISRLMNKIKQKKICVIGENILDSYISSSPLGRSSKSSALVVSEGEKITFNGGATAIAKNLLSFHNSVSLISHGKLIKDSSISKIDKKLLLNCSCQIEKERIVDSHTKDYLLEIYKPFKFLWKKSEKVKIKNFLKENKFDILICSDFGHGFFDQEVIEILSSQKSFLCLNVQSNAGNRGFNFVTKWHKSDYLTVTEEELKLALQDKSSEISDLVLKLKNTNHHKMINVTQGSRGSTIFNKDKSLLTPAFASNVLDRVGAGDSLLAATAGLSETNAPLAIIGLIGNIAGSESLRHIANSENLNSENILKISKFLLK